ncbi:MAG: RDD family protein [Nanoarchaeota archaeon]|nr:RDD family protein [Nanoarchaeota archaeon]
MAKKGLNLPKERTFTGPALVWKRILAFITDILIINAVVFFPFKRIIQGLIPDFGSYSEAYHFLISNQSYTARLTAVSLVMALFAILYFVILEHKLRQTPGKILMNIFVESEVKELGFLQCVVRSIFVIPAFPFFLLWVIDPVFMVFTKGNRRLSEILSRTRTVETYRIG